MLNFSKNNTVFFNFLLIFLLFVSNFLYSTEIYNIQIKHLAFLSTILCFYKIFNVDKKFLYLLISLSIFLSIHIFFVSHFNIKNSLSIIFFISTLLLVYLNFSFIKKNFFKINYYFFLILSLLLLLLISLIVIKDQDLLLEIGYLTNISCGGIRINDIHYFFKENSHIALVLPSLFFSFLYSNKPNILNIFFKILYLVFIISFFSLTMLVVNLLALVLITIYSIDIYKKNIFFFIILISTLIYPIIFNNACLYKLHDLQRSDFVYEETILSQEEENIKKEYMNEDPSSESTKSMFVNLSAFVYINHFDIVKDSLKSKYFGYGFNNYEELFLNHIEKQSLNLKDVYKQYSKLNYNDAASNVLKILGEFGVLSTLLIVIFIIFLLPNNIDNRIKVITSIIIISQLIRGTGYFNFSFLIYSCLVFVYVFKLFFDKNKI